VVVRAVLLLFGLLKLDRAKEGVVGIRENLDSSGNGGEEK